MPPTVSPVLNVRTLVAMSRLRRSAITRFRLPSLIAFEDGPDPLGLGFVDSDLAVPGVIAERRHAADPQTLALGGGNFVADPLGGDLALELGKRQQDVEGQPPHRGDGIELLGH